MNKLRLLTSSNKNRLSSIEKPQGFLISFGTELEGFDTYADWSSGGGTGTWVDDPEDHRTGTSSLKITPATSTSKTLRKTISKVFGTAPERVRLFYYNEAAQANYNSSPVVYLSSTTGFTKYFIYTHASSVPAHIGWNVLDIYPDQWTNFNAESWSNTMVRLQVRVGCSSGNSNYTVLDSLVYNIAGTPAIMIGFDDNDNTIYNQAFIYCKPRGVRCTNYCISSQIASGTNITEIQYKEMYNFGWTIGNHTKDHVHLSELSLEDAQTQLRDCRLALDALGFTNTSRHVAYPFGDWNETTLSAFSTEGMLTGRTIVGGAYPIASTESLSTLPVIEITNTTTLNTAKGYLDHAKTYGNIIHLLLHRIIESPTTSNEWSIENFRGLIDYGLSIKLPFITINDFYNSISGSVRIRI